MSRWDRNPSADPTPLDWASFFIEDLKFGYEEPKGLERANEEEVVYVAQELLDAAHVDSMTGQELVDAMLYYCRSHSEAMGVPIPVALSLFWDGLLHGIGLAGGVKGEHRHSKGRSG